MAFESIVVGSGTLFIAPEGEAFPVVDVAPAGNWVSMGRIDGGVQVNHPQTVDLHRTDEDTGPLKATRSEEDLVIIANLAEATLENLSPALNNNSVTADAGPPSTKTLPMYRGTSVTTHSFLLRVNSPYGNFNAQFEVPIGIIMADQNRSFTKDAKVVTPIEIHAIIDPTAATEAERFGRLIAQDA